jgi:transcriptional regulator with XRE-family HTH domain
MQIDALLTDGAVLAELGRRLARHRLERNWTQAELAARAGVGKATVQRIERGESVQMSSTIRIWRALELLDGIDAAVPESIELPIARLEREQGGSGTHARRRARARQARGARPYDGAEPQTGAEPQPAEPGAQPWRWGDEPNEPDVRG